MAAGEWEGSERSLRRRPPAGLAIAGLVVAVGAGLLLGGRAQDAPEGLVVERSTDTEPDVTVAYEPPGVVPELNGTWQRTAPTPLAGRVGASATWTGEVVMVWGGVGSRAYTDGALYDPDRDDWRSVDPGPLAARYGHAALWDGDEVVVAGGLAVLGGDTPIAGPRLRDAAAFSPATGRWRMLPSLPFDAGAGRVFARDGRLYAVAPRAQRRPVAVLDAGSAMWRLGPAVQWEEEGDQTAATLTGDALVLWPAARGEAVVLDLAAQRWSAAAHTPQARPLATCACRLLSGVMPSGTTDVIAQDVASAQWWRPPIGRVQASFAGGPDDLLFLVQTPAVTRVLNRRTGLVLTPPRPPENLGFQPAAVWAGDRLFVWGGVSGVRMRYDVDGLTFRPGGALGHSRIKVL